MKVFAALSLLIMGSIPNTPHAQQLMNFITRTTIPIVIQCPGCNARNQAKRSPSAQPAPNPQRGEPVALANPVELSFATSPALRKRNFAGFISGIRANNPGSADQLQQLLDGAGFSGKLDARMKAKGLATNNIADAFANYWMSVWLGSRGQASPVSAAQAQKTQAFAQLMLQDNPALADMDDAAKQAVADNLLIQAGLMDILIAQTQGNSEQLTQLAQMARRGASEWGLDLDAMELTADGFVDANRP